LELKGETNVAFGCLICIFKEIGEIFIKKKILKYFKYQIQYWQFCHRIIIILSYMAGIVLDLIFEIFENLLFNETFSYFFENAD